MIAGSRTPIIAVAVYLGLVALAIGIGLSGACCGEQGILATLLTLPWSIVTLVGLDAIDSGLIDRVGVVAIVPGALVNAVLVYRVMRSRSRRGPGPNEDRPSEPAA